MPHHPVIHFAALAVAAIVLRPVAAVPTDSLPTGASASGGRLIIKYPGHAPAMVASVQGVSDPALSPDKREVAFIQAAPGAKIETGLGDADPDQIWMLDTATLHPTRLVVSRPSDGMKQVLGDLSSPVFSADGRQIYFLSSAWVTSDAVHAVDVQTHRVRFVTDGSTIRVLRTGHYRGDLIVNKHKYRLNEGGAYDADFLASPSGREIKIWSSND